jgi:hypothetical protein
MPGWLMFYPVLGDFLERKRREHVWPLRWAASSAAALAGLIVIIVGQASTGYGKMLFPGLFVHGDPTLDATDWSPLAAELKTRGYLDDKHLFIVAPDWIAAGRIDVALGGEVPVTVFPANEPKNFEFLHDHTAFLGRDALVIGHSFPAHFAADVRQFFNSVEDVPPYWLGRSGMQEIELKMMLARKLLRPFPEYYTPPAQ